VTLMLQNVDWTEYGSRFKSVLMTWTLIVVAGPTSS
jgi:hypothetical protein